MMIVYVREPAAAYCAGDMVVDGGLAGDEGLRQQLATVVPTDPSVPHRHELRHGDPIGEIVRLANEEKADMIVMGTHGRTGLTRLLMGSVAEAIVRRADCPVLTVKHPPDGS